MHLNKTIGRSPQTVNSDGNSLSFIFVVVSLLLILAEVSGVLLLLLHLLPMPVRAPLRVPLRSNVAAANEVAEVHLLTTCH